MLHRCMGTCAPSKRILALHCTPHIARLSQVHKLYPSDSTLPLLHRRSTVGEYTPRHHGIRAVVSQARGRTTSGAVDGRGVGSLSLIIVIAVRNPRSKVMESIQSENTA